MAELLLVSNPSKRGGRKMKRKHKRKMSALQRKYFGGKRHRKHTMKATPKRRRHKRRHHTAAVMENPKRRRHRKQNPHHRAKYRRKRNPSFGSIGASIAPTVKAGAWGAAGALGLDVLWGLLIGQLPSIGAMLANPYIGFAAKALGAVAVGSVGGHLARGKGRELAVGAMTVVTHDFLKTTLQGLAPTIFGVGGSLPLGAYLSDGGGTGYAGYSGMGTYLSGAAPIVGTASIPQAYLPFAGSSGTSGNQDGVYQEDRMGIDSWTS
jgi:hypothetical protein